MNRRYNVSAENRTCPCNVRALSPGNTGRSSRSVPSRVRTGIGVTNAASRWRAVRTSRVMIPGMCTSRANASLSPTHPVSNPVVVTVAVRGIWRNSAISPTIVPAKTCSTVTTPSAPTCVTSAAPDAMSRKDTARSPWRIST
jgi:hypothetical protein